jgi:DnaA family protein
MAQLPLALHLATHAVFETFVGGGNGAALAHVEALASGTIGGAIWLSGSSGSGKSHVLQAACRAASRAGRRAMYLPLRAPEVGPELLAGLEELDFVALDDLTRAAGIADWETRLFQVLNGFQAGERGLLMAAEAVPSGMRFALPDLASRAAGAVVYRLQTLADADQVEALQRHARHRGLDLDAAAARFLQARLPRDMSVLCAWLERLDTASLAAQRRLTLPFVREVLGGGASAPPAARGEEQPELRQGREQDEAD